ncbi:hypothetical protein MMC06_004647 [Schaereria dolodes]|nr:hypothetical protein [Schaereria dolodes]
MAPPSATTTETETNGLSRPSTKAPLEPGLNEKQAKVQMPRFPRPPKFEDKYEEREYLKGRLAAAFRIFGKFGYDEGVAGHITLRDPVDPTTFWVNPFGVAFSLLKRSDLIQVDHSGKVIDGGPVRLLNAAAFMIHGAIHSARPDVMCAAHSHSLYGKAFCSLGKKLDIITQDSCAFHDVCVFIQKALTDILLMSERQDHVLYENFNGVVLAEKEGRDIAACLGNKKAALLQNHGLLTVGETIEAAVYWFMNLERCCHAQLLADAAAHGRGGETTKIGDAEARYTWKTIGTPIAGWFNAKPTFDLMEKEASADYLQ